MATETTKTIELNGENYVLGTPAITIGLDTNCFKCVCYGRLVYENGDPIWYGNKGYGGTNLKSVPDFKKEIFVDTKENRNKIQRFVLESKKEYFEGCKAQCIRCGLSTAGYDIEIEKINNKLEKIS